MTTTAPDFLDYLVFHTDGSYGIAKGSPDWVASALDEYLNGIEDSLNINNPT